MSNVEKHYSEVIEIINALPDGEKKLGLGVAWAYFDDPRHLLFTLARYKFASKILNGKKKLLRDHHPHVVGKQFEKSIERFLNDKPAEDFQKKFNSSTPSINI